MVIQVGETQDKQQITLKVHQRFEISLPENRTTGFRWTVRESAEPICRLFDDDYEAPGGGHGQGGKHRWKFEAVQAGDVQITLEYRRAWQKSTPPARTFTLTVCVES